MSFTGNLFFPLDFFLHITVISDFIQCCAVSTFRLFVLLSELVPHNVESNAVMAADAPSEIARDAMYNAASDTCNLIKGRIQLLQIWLFLTALVTWLQGRQRLLVGHSVRHFGPD